MPAEPEINAAAYFESDGTGAGRWGDNGILRCFRFCMLGLLATALTLAVPTGSPGQARPALVKEQAQQDMEQPLPVDRSQLSSGTPQFLQGNVEHSERLEAVAPQLRAGAVFNEQSIPQLEPNNDWYWIPAWYAGQKHADTDTILEDYDFRTGQVIQPNQVIMNRQDLFIGFQLDRNGQIWEFKRAPYRTTLEGNTFFEIMLVRNRDPIQVTPDKVVVRLVQTAIMVDKASQRIQKTEQQEQINTYIPTAPGVMTVQTSIKSFGADGAPLIQEYSSRVVVNRAPFQPVDYYQGRDMRILFRDFMRARGLAHLLPDYLSGPANRQ